MGCEHQGKNHGTKEVCHFYVDGTLPLFGGRDGGGGWGGGLDY